MVIPFRDMSPLYTTAEMMLNASIRLYYYLSNIPTFTIFRFLLLFKKKMKLTEYMWMYFLILLTTDVNQGYSQTRALLKRLGIKVKMPQKMDKR